MAVIVSAMGDTTDNLIDLAAQITDNPSPREMDMLLSTGEQMSVALLAMAVQSLGSKAISFTGSQLEIVTDDIHTKAKIRDIKQAGRVHGAFKDGNIVIIAGFQGVSSGDDITTLGRGGSDLTAVAIAKVLGADLCEIYTDVEGIFTADPRIVSDARKLAVISYDEMLEMASLGAQVMQARSIEFAKKYDVNIVVRSSMSNAEGTLITKEVKDMEDLLITGVTNDTKEAKISVNGVPDKPGMAAKIFNALGNNNIGVDMIIQSASQGSGDNSISFTVQKTDLRKALEITESIAKEIGVKGVSSVEGIAKVSVVGIGMKSHSGVAGRMFSALAGEKINIEMISTSEIKISCVIKLEDVQKAVRVLHKEFGLGQAGGRKK